MRKEIRKPSIIELYDYKFPNGETYKLHEGYYLPKVPMKYNELDKNHHNIQLYTKK